MNAKEKKELYDLALNVEIAHMVKADVDCQYSEEVKKLVDYIKERCFDVQPPVHDTDG